MNDTRTEHIKLRLCQEPTCDRERHGKSVWCERFVGIELNADYIKIAHERVRKHFPLFSQGVA